jgi:hypothetical protein
MWSKVPSSNLIVTFSFYFPLISRSLMEDMLNQSEITQRLNIKDHRSETRAFPSDVSSVPQFMSDKIVNDFILFWDTINISILIHDTEGNINESVLHSRRHSVRTIDIKPLNCLIYFWSLYPLLKQAVLFAKFIRVISHSGESRLELCESRSQRASSVLLGGRCA